MYGLDRQARILLRLVMVGETFVGESYCGSM